MPSAKKPFAEGQARPSAKIFFFLVFLAQFFLVLQYIVLNSILKFGLILTFFVYFLNLFRFFDFFRIRLQCSVSKKCYSC